MNEWALATLAASSISIWFASGLPKSMFSLMVVAKRAGSWLTSPICCLNHLSFNVFMSCPSSSTSPAQAHYLTEISHPTGVQSPKKYIPINSRNYLNWHKTLIVSFTSSEMRFNVLG